MEGTGGPAVTVTVQMAVLLPSAVVAVIVVCPAATPVTTPLLTVAILASPVDQVTVLLVAFGGSMVAVSVVVPFTCTLAVVGFSVIPVTATASTVTVQDAVIELSVVEIAVMVAVPAATPVTLPELSTVAILLLLLVQFTALPVLASVGV